MLRRPATTLQITSEDLAAYEDRRAREALEERRQQYLQQVQAAEEEEEAEAEAEAPQQQQQQQQQPQSRTQGRQAMEGVQSSQDAERREREVRRARDDRIGINRRPRQ